MGDIDGAKYSTGWGSWNVSQAGSLSLLQGGNTFSNFVQEFGSLGPTCERNRWAIMQNMIFDSVFEVDSVLENKSDF